MNASESARDTQRDFRELQLDAEALSAGLLEVQAAGRGYASTGDARYARRAVRAFHDLEEQFEQLSLVVDGADVNGDADEAKDAVEEYLGLQGPSILELPERVPSEVRRSIATGEGQRRVDSVRAKLDQAESQFETMALDEARKADSYSDRSRIASIVAIVAGLLTLGLVSVYMLVAVRRPIDELDRAASELGQGEEETRVDPSGARELRALGIAFNDMADQLAERRKQLQSASQAKSDFLARMSHELRTPLNAILGFGQLLEMDDLEESERESVRQILRAGRHLLDLIDEVLDISRIESGTLRISMEPVSLATVLGDVRSMVAPLAAEREVTLHVEAAEDGLHVVADQQRLKQVLLNLLSNGIKYNRQGGELKVSAMPVDGEVQILVADTGTGIDPEFLDDLFTPFERLGAERKGAVEGTGLGLALSQRLVTLMDGVLELRESDGSGTTFAVRMARAEAPASREVKVAATDRPDSRGTETVVVCIEDNASNFELVKRILDDNFEAKIYSSIQGSIGLDLVRKHLPDVVLLDLHLPDISGEEVLSRIKADPATADIPVLILSADATSGHRRRLIAAGAMNYLTKPLNVKEFLEQMDHAVNPDRAEVDG